MDNPDRVRWLSSISASGRLWLVPIFLFALLIRYIAGFFSLSGTSPVGTVAALVFFFVLAVFEIFYCRFFRSNRFFHSLSLILSVLLFSTVAFIDLVFLGPGALSPWAFLILASLAFDYGCRFLLLAAVPLAAGLLDALGIFPIRIQEGPLPSFSPDLGKFFLLLLASLLAWHLYRVRSNIFAALYRNQKLFVEKERSLSALRDAEVEIAARIQRSLLLEPPGNNSSGLSMEALTVASNAVDGDFYSFIPYGPCSVDILVGDVMGKGVPAALLGAALKSSFMRSSLSLLVKDPLGLPNPATLVSTVHQAVVTELMELESFATLQYARIDSSQARMDFVDCGHTPILHYDHTVGFCWAVKGSDLPMGFIDDSTYNRFILPLSSGDRLLFYSDGITEAPGSDGELFGEERLSEIVTANAHFSPSELIRRILNTAMYFSSSSGFRDDVTCVAVSLEPNAQKPARFLRDFPAELSCLPEIRNFIEATIGSGVDQALLHRVILAADEAVSNVIIHAINPVGACVEVVSTDPEELSPGGDLEELDAEAVSESPFALDLPNCVLRFECIETMTWFAIRIIYRGTSFAWHRKPLEREIETFPEGGYGRSLIAAAADSVLYAAGPGNLHLACVVFLKDAD